MVKGIFSLLIAFLVGGSLAKANTYREILVEEARTRLYRAVIPASFRLSPPVEHIVSIDEDEMDDHLSALLETSALTLPFELDNCWRSVGRLSLQVLTDTIPSFLFLATAHYLGLSDTYRKARLCYLLASLITIMQSLHSNRSVIQGVLNVGVVLSTSLIFCSL